MQDSVLELLQCYWSNAFMIVNFSQMVLYKRR